MWRRFFLHRWCLPALAVLGVLLTAPSLNAGLFGDDFVHRALLLGQMKPPHAGAGLGLFTFVDGDPAHIQALKESGRLLWWAADSLRLSFWRPLTELTHWLDYQLWPDSPVLMHAHNLLWYGVLVLMLGRLYLLLDPDRQRAQLSTLLYAISSLHFFVVAWVAARNQLVAACFAVGCLLAFHHWRTGLGARYGWLAALALTFGLLSAEAAIATAGYLLAYVLVYEHGRPVTRRLISVLPFLALVVVWRLVYSHLGYGSAGSGAYIDPGANPVRFAEAVVLRLPTLLMAQLFGASSSVFNQLAHEAQALYALGSAAAAVTAIAVTHHLGLWASRLARFYGLGAALALVPICAAAPNDRLLILVEVGASGLLALLFCQMYSRREHYRGWSGIGAKLVVGLLAMVHLVVFPALTLASSALLNKVMRPTTIDEPLSLPDATGQHDTHVVLLNPPSAMLVYYYPLVRQYFGVTNAASMQALASGNQALTVSAVDESTLRLSGPKGFTDAMSRDATRLPFAVGQTVDIGQARVVVEEVSSEGVPTAVLVHFVAPMSNPRWRFFAWKDEGYAPFTLPATGQAVELPPVDLAKMAMSRLKSR